MSETVHDLLTASLREFVVEADELDLAGLALAVFREHGIKLCRERNGFGAFGNPAPRVFVPLTDEEIGQ